MNRLSPRLLHAQVFCTLWGVAHIAHILRKEAVNDPFAWLCLLTSVLLIQRPTSPARLGLLGLAQIAMFAVQLPVTDNHMYIMAFVNAGLLAVVAPMVVRRRAWDGEAFETMRNYAVVVFLASYAAAALAKLNRDFLSTEASCALTMLDDAASVVGLDRTIFPASVLRAVPFVIAGIELAVPTLLAMRRTRTAGIVLAVLFHLGISLSPTGTAIDFTIVIVAVLALLIPVGDEEVTSVARSLPRASRFRPPIDAGTVGVLGLFFVLVVFRWKLGTVAGNRGWMLLAPTALGLGAVLVFAAVRLRGASDGYRVSLSRLKAAHYPLLALLALNVAAPYLGLKTVGTYTMYSNLDTYQNASNHYLIPRLNPDSFHDDMVEVLDTSNERLRVAQEDSLLITWHELRRTLARDPEARVVFRRGGRQFAYERAADDPELVTLDPVLHRLLAHRVQPTGPGRCLW